MPNLGIHVNRKAAAVSSPVVADSGIPFAVGTAPVHTAAKPGKPNRPVLCTSWDEAVEKLGFSYDWKKYTLCEAIYSHFKLYECQPIIFCNVLDPADADMKKTAVSKPYDVAEHRITLPFETIKAGLKVTNGEGENAAQLIENEDYTLFYDEQKNKCVIELLEDSAAYSAPSLTVEAAEMDPGAVTTADIAMGIGQVDACMTAVGVIPDILLAPGYSHDAMAAAILAMKAAGIDGLFKAKTFVDIDSSSSGVTEYSALPGYKAEHGLLDPNQIACWPKVTLDGMQFHLSTQLAGVTATVDAANGCPYDGASNKSLKIDGCCLEDGTEVDLTWEQVNLIAGSWGIVTAINFIGMGWTAKGNYTACFNSAADGTGKYSEESDIDIMDKFISISRMADWVGNTLIRTFWSKLDRPMTRLLIDNILDTCNLWLVGQVSAGHLLGARAVMLEEENSLLDLMAGIIHIHIYITPPGPMQECNFTLEYDIGYVQSALAA